jgi:hypothetical protein
MADPTHSPQLPVPDPTTLTTQALDRQLEQTQQLVETKLEVVRTRIDAIDRATEIFQDSLVRVPTDVDKQVGNLRALHDERFNSVTTQIAAGFDSVTLQFEERDKRGERESRDNKVAVDAAFAAQKEAASEQNKSNTLAISKSEAATSETINKLEQLVSANIGGLTSKVDDVKSGLGAVRQEFANSVAAVRQELIAFQSRSAGGQDQRSDNRAGVNMGLAIFGAVATLISIVALIYGFTGR